MSESETCSLNRCGRPLGVGTHATIASGRNGQSHQIIAVCEEHWQALRVVLPAPEPCKPTDPSHGRGGQE